MLERYFTPYHCSSAVIGDRIAILAPHPDDEIFGCGGSACKWAEQGKHIKVFILSDGVLKEAFSSGPDTEQRQQNHATLRANESRNAAQILGLPAPYFLNGQDGHLWDESYLEQQLSDELSVWQPTTIVAPSIWEMHRDHRATAELAIRLAAQLQSVALLSFYEIGVPLLVNVLEDTTLYQPRKAQAMECFATQLESQHYADQIAGLNVYRTYTLGLDVRAAEGFHCIPADELADFSHHYRPTQTTLALRSAERAHQAVGRQIEEQQQRVFELEQQLQQTRSSRSWRITRPLRWLNRQLKRHH